MRRDGTFLVPTLNAPVAIAAGGLAAGIPEFMVRKSELVMPAHVASFQLAHKRGVRIAAGADSGTPLNFHGSLLPELELMVKYGMTPLEAIRSATTIAADCLGLGAVTGRIAPGYAADLIAVAGDPAERIEALADLKLVLAQRPRQSGGVARPPRSAAGRGEQPEPGRRREEGQQPRSRARPPPPPTSRQSGGRSASGSSARLRRRVWKDRTAKFSAATLAPMTIRVSGSPSVMARHPASTKSASTG